MYEIFEKLCEQNGITPYKFCKDTGISTSTISTWKTKGSLCGPKLQEAICKYFDVSVDYLMKGEKTETKYYLNDETAAIAQDIFENKELRALFSVQRDMSLEDLKALHNMALALKRKETNIEE